MLPVLDADGRLTGQVMTSTAAMLIPIGLFATLFGVSGWWSAVASVLLGGWFGLRCLLFWRRRTNEAARSAFLASLAYLPLVLGVMVLDRGPVNPETWLRGGRRAAVSESVVPEGTAPALPTPMLGESEP